MIKWIRPSKKGLINIQNVDDNECFKWCLVRYLHPADHYPTRIRKTDKLFGDELDLDIFLTLRLDTFLYFHNQKH